MKRQLLIPVLFFLPSLVFSQTLKQADSLLIAGEYRQVITLVDQHLGHPSEQLALQNKKAEALIRLGNLDEATQLLKTLASARTGNDAAMIETTEGLLYLNQGRTDLALERLRQALEKFGQQNRITALEVAQAMSYLGLTYNATGKYAQAEEQLQQALAIRESILKRDHELIAASYNDLGIVYFNTDKDKALDYYEKALAIYERLHGKEHPKIAFANTNMGIAYQYLQLYGDAVNNFETALKIWEKIYPQPHPAKAIVLFNLGDTYWKMGDRKAARGYFERALSMYQSTYGAKHPETARALFTLGNLEVSESNFDAGLHRYQEALKANVSDFDSNDLSANPNLKNFYNGNVLLYTLMLKAQALESQHFGKTLKFADLDLALKTLQTCDTLIDQLRQHSANESDKIALGVIANEVYGDGVRISVEAMNGAVKKKPYSAQAFYFAEKSKSAVLLEAISDSDAKSFAGIPAGLLEEEKNLKTAIALTSRKLAQKPPVEEEKYLRETSFQLNRAYETFVRDLEKQFPAYFNLKFNSSSPSISQLQALLDNKTALLSYFIDDKNNRIYTFIITARSYRIAGHALPKEFDKLITGVRNGLFFNVQGVYATAARSLAKLLIPNALPSRISNLVILPTGRLSIIPFETLLTKNTKTKSFQDLPYLIRDFAVRYEFSAGLLLQKSKQADVKKPSVLLCAPVTFPEKENLAELPGTESEVKDIAQLFASKQVESDVYLRENANEHALKNQALKKYSMLHFATHGVVDENDPELSRIFLQSASEAEDGNLFAGEIYNLELDANLVTLSACQTGLGKISKGEGVIGLSRALVYAGAKNIMVSFWSVADESTARLMKKFYEGLLNDPAANYAESLRQAKLSLLKDEQYAAPYYWAPFILIGF